MKRIITSILLLFSLTIWPDAAKAEMYASKEEAYAACLPNAKTAYEARIVSSYATDYRCVKFWPDSINSNVYTGEIYLKNCIDCPYFWSHGYGIFEWPLLPFAPEKNLGQNGCCVGNPINPATGNKYQREEDITAVGLLSFIRHYNSYGAFQEHGLGRGWTHSYSRRIEHSSSINNGTSLKLHRPTGGFLYFFRQPNGSWISDRDNFYELLARKDESGNDIGWELINKSDHEIEIYDEIGRLISIINQHGDYLLFEYGLSDGTSNDYLPTKAIDRSSRSISFSYDGAGKLVEITDPSGELFTYSYDNEGRLSSVAFPGSTSKLYTYNENSFTGGANLVYALTGIVDESAARFATFKYSAAGKAISTEHNGSVEKFSVKYLDNNYSIVTDPSNKSRYWFFSLYDGTLKRTSVQDICNGCPIHTTSTTYDTYGHIKQQTDRLGIVTGHVRTQDDLEIELTEAKGTTAQRKLQTDWDAANRLPIERRNFDTAGSLVNKAIWTYNPRGQTLTSTQVDPTTNTTRTVTSTYCEQADVTAGTCPLIGLTTSVDGPLAGAVDTTTYTYYPTDDATCATAPTTCPHRKGDLWKVTNALGQVTETLKYDGAGRVLSVKDPNGVVTDFEYHPRGWLTARKTRGANEASETDDQITRIEYWPTGLVKQVTQPDGAFTAYSYDAAHRLTDIADNAGNQIHYVLDNAGNRIQEETKDADGNLKRTLSRIYNQLGQLATQADAQANPTDFTYDANGNPDTVTDALGRVTDHDYDPLNRLARTLQDVGGIAAETQFQYDALDNLTRVTDPKGLDTTYTYNGLGDLTQLQSPDTGTTTYSYDSAGNRQTQTDARGVTTQYGYDALNRLTSVAYPDATLNVAYTYDLVPTACAAGEGFAVGRLSGMTDGSGSTQYCYDRFGHLVRKVQTTNGVTFVLRYAYTLAGQLHALVYPDGTTVDYVRDAQGRTTEVGVARTGHPREVLLHQARYHPFGPVAGWNYGNGRQMTRSLDQDYRPLAVQDAGTGGLSLDFGFDAVGNLTQLTSGSPPPIHFVYDPLGRLTETRDGPTQVAIDTYGYDKTGNRTAHTTAAGTSAYGYPTTSHRLTDVGGVIRAYDEAGNTLNLGAAKEFVYSAANRMSQVKQAGTVAMNYAYNGRGEQVRKHLGTSNTYTLYDEAGHWLGDYDSIGAPLQQALWMDDLPVGLLANGHQLHYLEPDHLGTPRVVIEVARNVPVWTWDVKGEAFGNTAPDQNPDGDANLFVLDMRFPGQRFDAASGLNYNYFRDYDAASGRYVESDPIGLWGGISTYAYVESNPTAYVDPLGFQRSGAQLSSATRALGLLLRGIYDDYRSTRAWGHQNFPGEENSFQRHCTVSCIQAKKYGAGFTRGMGVLNEYQGFYMHDLWDLPRRFRGDRPWAFQIDDLSANEKGFGCAGKQQCLPSGLDDTSTVSECEKCCALGVMYGY